jgi:hypothetical protein
LLYQEWFDAIKGAEMNNQEGMFADQEQQPYEPYTPRDINADPREQPRQEASQEGYAGYEEYTVPYPEPDQRRMGGAKIYPQPPRRRRKRLFWPVLVLIVVLLFAGFGFVSNTSIRHGGIGPQSVGQAQLPRVFNITGAPTLIIKDNNGDVHIHTGSTDSVIFQATVSDGFGDNARNAPVRYQQNGDVITVTTAGNVPFIGLGQVDLDVTVPTNASVQIDSGSGSIEVDGTSGSVTAHSLNGDVTINSVQGAVQASSRNGDVTLSNVTGQMTLQDANGDITASNVNGAMNASNGGGDINVKQGALSGQSLLRTDSGDISFDGSLDPNGSYQMESGGGDVDVTLPANASFQLTTNGSDNVSNDFGSTTVGNGPHPPLQLNSGSGSISVNKGS